MIILIQIIKYMHTRKDINNKNFNMFVCVKREFVFPKTNIDPSNSRSIKRWEEWNILRCKHFLKLCTQNKFSSWEIWSLLVLGRSVMTWISTSYLMVWRNNLEIFKRSISINKSIGMEFNALKFTYNINGMNTYIIQLSY